MLKKFPFRLRGAQDEFFSTLATLVFTDPGSGVFTVNKMFGSYPNGGGPEEYNFEAVITPKRIEVSIYLNDIQKKNPKIQEWLNIYHHNLEKKRGIPMLPVPSKCIVQIHYGSDGSKKYYMWYQCTNADRAPLTGLPTGEWFAEESY